MSTPGRMWRGLWRRFRRDEESWEEAESGELQSDGMLRPALLRGIALYLSISDGSGSLGCHGANEKKNIELLPSDGRLSPKWGGYGPFPPREKRDRAYIHLENVLHTTISSAKLVMVRLVPVGTGRFAQAVSLDSLRQDQGR